MIAGPVGPKIVEPGDMVRVIDRADGRSLGFALWNPRSQLALRMFLRGEKPPDGDVWQGRVERAASLRREVLALDEETDAYRVVHAEGDGLPGLIVDRYADTLSIETFSQGMYQRLGPLTRLLGQTLGTRHARAHMDEAVAWHEGFQPRQLATPGAPEHVVIREHGLRYRVIFEGGHKTGFFCDQRENRKALASFCRDRSVLDLCCYAGGFALNALVNGRARDVTGVDLDEKAIAMARANMNLNQARMSLVHADAFGYARQMEQNGRKFGVVVLDPPKLILSREEAAPAKKKYYDLNSLALKLVEPGGILLSCSCSGLLGLDEFLSVIRAASQRVGRPAQVMRVTGASADHPVALDVPESSYLKAVWMRVGDPEAVPSLAAEDA
jgi:23S rRNA (cytosine1962-C5)-methyltransferase